MFGDLQKQKKKQESKIGKFPAVRMGEAFAIGKHTCWTSLPLSTHNQDPNWQTTFDHFISYGPSHKV